MLLGFGPQLWKETEAPHTRCGGSSSQAQKSLLGGSKPQRRWSELSGRAGFPREGRPMRRPFALTEGLLRDEPVAWTARPKHGSPAQALLESVSMEKHLGQPARS